MCLARWSCLRHVCGRAMFARKMVTPFPTPHTRSCWCCVLCAIFGAFPADLCKTVAFFNCIFTRPAGPAVAAPPPVVLPLLRSVSPLCTPRFASSSPRVRLVRRMFVQMCAFYTIFTHLRNFAFKCATHCHVDCCCSCSSLLLVYAQPLLSPPSLYLSLSIFFWESVWAENRTNVGSSFARVANCIWLPPRTAASGSVRVCLCMCVCVYVFMCAIHGSTDPRLVLRVYCQVITFTRVVLAVFVQYHLNRTCPKCSQARRCKQQTKKMALLKLTLAYLEV